MGMSNRVYMNIYKSYNYVLTPKPVEKGCIYIDNTYMPSSYLRATRTFDMYTSSFLRTQTCHHTVY